MFKDHAAVVTVKNKDFLLGYITAMVEINRKQGTGRIDPVTGETQTPEEANAILGQRVFDITCPECKYYHAFKTFDEIPDTSFLCPLCGKVYLIYYMDMIIKTKNGIRGIQIGDKFAEDGSWEYLCRFASIYVRTIMNLILLADKYELEKIEKAFPELVKSYKHDHFKKYHDS